MFSPINKFEHSHNAPAEPPEVQQHFPGNELQPHIIDRAARIDLIYERVIPLVVTQLTLFRLD